MSIEAFFNPHSIAVVGASRREGKVGYEILANLVAGGFEGRIYPVNPRADEIASLPCAPDLESLDEVPDLVVVALPAAAVPDVIRRCGKLGVRSVVVVSSGFREVGEAGERLERTVAQLAREAGIRLLGPNCLGLMNPAAKLNASFGGPLPPAGCVGYFSQSGSLLAAIVDLARGADLGFSKLVSIGNKADITELDVLRALGRDEQTRVIAGYLETISDGDAFIREAEQISHSKPILLMKAGETRAGAAAAGSHTGRLADTRRAYEVVFERAGIIRCGSIRTQFDCARALASQPLPAPADRSARPDAGVAIICNTGGLGIMAADAAEREGLPLARFTEATAGRLAESLPSAASTGNPIDVLGDAAAGRFEAALAAALDDPNVLSAVVLLTPHAMTQCDQTADAVARIAAGSGKPVLACFLGAERMRAAREILARAGVPCYDAPENALATLRALHDYARWRSRPKRVVKLFPVNRRRVEKVIQRNLRLGREEIGETEAHEVLDAYGFVTPRGMVATTAEQAADFAEQIGYPVVLKIWSPDIIHKTEVGGVRSGLTSRQEVMDAFDLMMYRIPRKVPDAEILGACVQEMCRGGIEVILGMHRDPHYGPLMMFGTGGVLVEVLRDVAFHLAPITAEEAREMLLSTRTYHLLEASPDNRRVDIDAVAEGLQRLSQLATEFPQIREMEINPYVVGPEGVVPIAVDARILVAEEPRP